MPLTRCAPSVRRLRVYPMPLPAGSVGVVGTGSGCRRVRSTCPARRRSRHAAASMEEETESHAEKTVDTPAPRARVQSGSPPPWSVLLQQALRAREAGAWREVGRLLTRLATAPDVPPTDPPSRVVQTWCTLQAHYWEHLAQYWHERARTAEETSADIALVMAAAREALQTLVRRVLDALDASGAPNPSVPEVCRELLKELEAVPWGALVAEEERARAARREGVHKDDRQGDDP